MKVGIVTFPGSLDDKDAARAVRAGGSEAVALWHDDSDLHGVDAVILPGGFPTVITFAVVRFLVLRQ